MSLKIYYQFLSLILLISSVVNSDVLKIDIDNYDKEVNLSKEIWLIEFYSEKCSTCKEFSHVWNELVKKINYIRIGRVNIDEPKGINLANKLNALENGIPCVRLNYGKDKTEDIMIGTEEPFPSAKTLQNRVDTILKKKGKLQNGKYLINEDL